MIKRFTIFVSIVFMCLVTSDTFAQDKPAFQNLRFEEDWSEFRAEESDSLLDDIKHIEISDSMWLSIGGNVRFRGENWNDFGFSDANDDEFLLQRYSIHGDLHIGDRWRAFLETRYTTLGSRDLPGGVRSALDADEGDIWNAFVEGNFEISGMDALFRVGRQELQYGAQRLVSPLEWANNRRIFEAILARFKSQSTGWQIDAFVSKPVMIEQHHFNDHNDDVTFGGVYYTNTFADGRYAVDAYLLTLHTYPTTLPDEERYTLGGRVVSKCSTIENLTAEIETAIQFGEVDTSDVQAYMLTAELTYRWDYETKPWATIGLDYASGDDDPNDGDAETFRHLFPLAHAFLGFADVVGRQNVIDLRATLGCWPTPKLRLRGDLHYLQLAEEEDGLYGANGTIARAGGVGEDEIGTEIDLTAFYVINRNMNVLAGYSRVFAGDFISATGSDEDIDFAYLQWNFKF